MHYYSYSGPGMGVEDPQNIHVVKVNGEQCDIETCLADHEYLNIMWTGEQYSKSNTWISADMNTVQDLEDCR